MASVARGSCAFSQCPALRWSAWAWVSRIHCTSSAWSLTNVEQLLGADNVEVRPALASKSSTGSMIAAAVRAGSTTT